MVLRASARPASEFCDRKVDHDGLARSRIFAVVKIGFRVLSLKKRIRARTSWKRALRHWAPLVSVDDRLGPALNQ